MSDVANEAQRLLKGDPSLFVGETAKRSLGWLMHPSHLEGDLTRFWTGWHDVRPPRHGRTIVLGMGGSSGPAGLFATAAGSGNVFVLDTSNPDSIAATDFTGANVIASSKSGTTIETITTLAWALSHGTQERDLSIITDPGTPLAELAETLGAKIFYGDPVTGGRFSALSAFGLVPAIAAGWSPEGLLATGFDAPPGREQFELWFSEGAHLTMLRDYVGWMAMSHAPLSGTGALWLEQLVAESTGKDGRGVIPIVDASGEAGPQPASLIRDVFAHHVRTSAMAWALGVDPFNQPDVEGAKRNVFVELKQHDEYEPTNVVTAEDFEALESAGYVALQVFGPLEVEADVETLRQRLATRFSRVTAGLGPRFLHATGQLHKGGPADVVALQVTLRPHSDPERISGRNYSFHDLHFAQARGDAKAMRASGRHVIELRVDTLAEAGSAIEA